MSETQGRILENFKKTIASLRNRAPFLREYVAPPVVAKPTYSELRTKYMEEMKRLSLTAVRYKAFDPTPYYSNPFVAPLEPGIIEAIEDPLKQQVAHAITRWGGSLLPMFEAEAVDTEKWWDPLAKEAGLLAGKMISVEFISEADKHRGKLTSDLPSRKIPYTSNELFSWVFHQAEPSTTGQNPTWLSLIGTLIKLRKEQGIWCGKTAEKLGVSQEDITDNGSDLWEPFIYIYTVLTAPETNRGYVRNYKYFQVFSDIAANAPEGKEWIDKLILGQEEQKSTLDRTFGRIPLD